MSQNQKAEKSHDTLLLPLQAAGALAGLTVWQLRGLISKKEIPVVRVGRKFLIRKQTLIRWCETAEETL